MNSQADPHNTFDRKYIGQILKGEYSSDLKKRLARYIALYRTVEKVATPLIPYISAWEEGGNKIWYEFVSIRFAKLLGCPPEKVAEVLRERILYRHVYRYSSSQGRIRKHSFDKEQLEDERRELRDDAKESRIMEAVYKISGRNDQPVWLKDLATVEAHRKDNIYLSLGNLTIVTKEMRSEQERLERERLQVLLETAGAVCHELNQPIQGISAYSEVILGSIGEDNPLYEKVKKIAELTKRMGEMTNKLRRITKYKTKDYLEGVKIVDIEESSSK